MPDKNLKAMTFEIAEQVHKQVSLKVPERYIPQRYRAQAYQTGQVSWEIIKRTVSRAPSIDVMQLVFESLRGKGVIVFIDSLEVPPSQAEIFQELGDVAQLAACLSDENRRIRIQKLLWKFQQTIELKPLRKDQVRLLAESWLSKKDIYFSSNNVRESFIRAVVQDSGGVPTAIEGMLTAATNDGEVTRASVSNYRHEAGTRYFDMMPVDCYRCAGVYGDALCFSGNGCGGAICAVRCGDGGVLWGDVPVTQPLTKILKIVFLTLEYRICIMYSRIRNTEIQYEIYYT